MSHACFNTFTISGAPTRVQAVAASLRGAYTDGAECLFAFDKVLPVPTDVADSHKWMMDNWGTYRYPIYCSVEKDGDDGELVMEFQSFNLPPEGVVGTLAIRHPDLDFALEWGTPDWYMDGRVVWRQGECVEDEGEWDQDAEERDRAEIDGD